MSYCRSMDAKMWALCHEGEEHEEWYEEYDDNIHGSSVYVIGSCDSANDNDEGWHLECLGCSLVDMTGQFVELNGKEFQAVGIYYAKGQSEMIAHLKKHISIGERVPKAAFDRLQREIDEGQDWP